MLGALKTESENWLRLDMLRFVASMGIVWNHSHEFYWPVAERVDPLRSWGLFVDLFFVISGFIIAALYTDRVGSAHEVRRFLQKRVARLIPLHWLVLIAMLAFWQMAKAMGIHADSAPDTSARCVTHNALLLNAFWACGKNAISPVSWSIGVEMALYALFPLVAIMSRRRGVLEIGAVVALVMLAIHVAQQDGVVTDAAKMMRGVPSFLVGALLFKYCDRLTRLANPHALPILLLLLIVAMADDWPQTLTLLLVYLVAAVAVASDTKGGDVPVWVRKLAPWGVLTYSLYMWHMVFILVLMNALGDKLLHLSTLPMIGLGVVCYAAIVIWSYWSWIYFERPARRAIDSLGRRGSERAAA